jgi:hypothetical protein
MKEKAPEKEIVVHEGNGSFITKGLFDYVKAKVIAEGYKVDHALMANSQWKKIVASYEEEYGLREGTLEFLGVPVKVDRKVPESEIWFCAKDGSVGGKMVGMER